jgi:hypothetical protein
VTTPLARILRAYINLMREVRRIEEANARTETRCSRGQSRSWAVECSQLSSFGPASAPPSALVPCYMPRARGRAAFY